MSVRTTEGDIGRIGTPVHQHDSIRPRAHVISRSYTVCPRSVCGFYCRLRMLHVKEASNAAELRKGNDTHCLSFRKAYEAHRFLADEVKWMQALLDVIRSIFVALRHVLARILSKSKPSIPQDHLNNYHCNLIPDIENHVRAF